MKIPPNIPLDSLSIQIKPDPRRYGNLPPNVPVTPAFRAEFNAWAKEFFQPAPELNPIKDGDYWITEQTVYMNPRTYKMLQEALKPKTRSQKLREAGYTRRPSWKCLPPDGDDGDDELPTEETK
jgi:hypothetical protein